MAKNKPQFLVEKRCGTVISEDDGTFTIMDNSRIFYRIDTKGDNHFSGLDLKCGDFVWLHCVPSEGYVLTVFNSRYQSEPDEIKDFFVTIAGG